MSHDKNLAILVAGGPAPGINSVIGSATIRGALDGVNVLGIRDGFEWIMKGDVAHVVPLGIEGTVQRDGEGTKRNPPRPFRATIRPRRSASAAASSAACRSCSRTPPESTRASCGPHCGQPIDSA